MLRHAIRRNRASSKSSLQTIVCRSKSTGNLGIKRQSHDRNSKPRPSRTAQSVRPPLRRPDFLQSLRVRTPVSNEAVRNTNARINPSKTKDESTSKLGQKFRQGHTFELKSKDPFPKPRTATQSNLKGAGSTSKPNPPYPGLVDFFAKRMEEVKAGTRDNIEHQETKRATYGARPLRGPGRPNLPRPQSYRSNPRKKAFGLHAALSEAHLAQRNADEPATSTPPSELSTIREVLEKSGSNITTANNDKNTIKVVEGMSPIREYVAALKKKNQEKKEEQRATESQDPPVPSWRKAARSFSRGQGKQQETNKDPLFVSQSGVSYEEQMQHERALKLWEEQKQKKRKAAPEPVKEQEIVLPSYDVTVSELSLIFRVKAKDIMKGLRGMGESPEDSDEYRIDVDTAEMLALELDIKFRRAKRRPKVDNDHDQLMNRRRVSNENQQETTESLKYGSLAPRAPVVTIMGHVDHGKTTLMDTLRRRAQGGTKQKTKSKKSKKSGKKSTASKGSDVAGTEAGGITQVISAFQVPLVGDQKDTITFLDTPGHAAFSAMRQSGSHAADIVLLVIAADDGVSPQTIEILNFYKSIVKDSDGGITMVVAINKIDKPGVDVAEAQRRIENQLLEHDIVPEGLGSESDYGSPVQLFPISAKTGDGVDDLIEGLALQSEVMDLRADDTAKAEGIVMDARVEQGLGVVADCIVRWGSIQKGDVVVSDTSAGKVRILKDVNDKAIKKGMPSQPVRIVGFKTAPKAGDPIVCVSSEKVADDLVERRLAIKDKTRSSDSSSDANFSQVIISGGESMTNAGTERRLQRYELSMEDTGPIRIPIVVKAKADGSVAAVRDSLKMLGEESSFGINVDPIAEGVGMLTMNEIEMAKESNAVVFCFDVKNQDKAVVALAEAEGVTIHEFSVIYSLLDHAREIFTDFLPPVPIETVHGKATVQAVFPINNGKDSIAGLKVLDGYLYKSSTDDDKAVPVHFRVLRDGKRVSPEGEEITASSLKHFKEDVESVRLGEECGLSLNGTKDFKEGDIVECYSIEMKKNWVR